MEYANRYSSHHPEVESSHLSRMPIEHRYRYAKYGIHQESYHSSSHTKCRNNRSEAIKHGDIHDLLRLEQAIDYQNNAITHIAHTESKEEQIEWCQNGRRIKLTIRRPTIHTRKWLKDARKLVVVQFNRRLVFVVGICLLIIDMCCIELIIKRFHFIYRAESFKQTKRIFSCSVSRKLHFLPIDSRLASMECQTE